MAGWALAVFLVLAGLGLMPGSVWGASGFGVFERFGAEGSGPGQFLGTGGIAVNQSSGAVFVVDAGNGRFEQFSADGSDSDVVAEVPAPTQIAVDNSKGESAGDVYVVDSADGVIEKFSSEGNKIGEVEAVPVAQISETEPGATFAADGGVAGIAVDSAGNLWVAQASGEVDEFDGARKQNAFVKKVEFAAPQPEPPATGAFALDEAEHLYLDQGFGGECCGVEQRSLTGEDLGRLLPSNFVGSLALDPGGSRLFALQEGFQVQQFGTDRSEIGVPFGIEALGFSATGLAFDHASGHLYVADGTSVAVFEPVTLPSVTIDEPTELAATHVHVSGSVNPEGTEPVNATSWRFEVSTDGGGSWSATGKGGSVSAKVGSEPVADEATFLPNFEHVLVRLAATDAGGTVTSEVKELTPPGVLPLVTTGPAQDLAPEHSSLEGDLNPENSPTTYWFEYGTTTAYGTSVPAGKDAPLESFSVPQEVTPVPVYGLAPGTTYHYRLVARNAVGTTDGEDATFTTTTPPPPSTGCPNEAIREQQHSQFLPDCRAYEMVSPPDKNGGDVMADSKLVRAASDGDAVTFASLTAFGDAIGTGIASEYLSSRGPEGWTTHAITPPQQPTPVAGTLKSGARSLYEGFSEDLSAGVFVGWSPVTEDPTVAGVPNLYRRSDPKSAGSGSYQLLTACPLCQSTGTSLPAALPAGQETSPQFAGASADYGHVLFQSQQRLTSEVPAGCENNFRNLAQCPPNLYEWDHGTLRAVGVLPDGSPSTGSQAGGGTGGPEGKYRYTPDVISADGSRVFFTVPGEPNLYMRVNHSTTVALNASERTTCADHDPCDGSPEPDPGGAQGAGYEDATPDGSRVIFASSEALTDDAPTDGVPKLYMYDTSKPDSDPHNLTLIAADRDVEHPGEAIGGVLGTSADGQYVYFTANGPILPGQSPFIGFNGMIYVWHDGTIRPVAPIERSFDEPTNIEGQAWDFNPKDSRVSPDGLHLLFSSTHPGPGPTGYDQECAKGSCREMYVYGYASQRVSCVSCDPSGSRATGEDFTNEKLNDSGAKSSPSLNRPLSDDGTRVFFTSPDALVPQDVNGKDDVYEYDVPTGALRLITSGRDPSDSYFLNASPSGNDVFILTRARLVGSDTDTSYDVYDARVGGGFVEPASGAQPCQGEDCLAPQAGAAPASGPSTGLVAGSGNLSAPSVTPPPPPRHVVHCRKGTVRSRGHGRHVCVKVKQHRHRASVRKAGALRATTDMGRTG